MKKMLITLVIFTAGFATNGMAQRMDGNFDPAKMKARQIEKLKSSDLHLTDAQADSVVSINMETMQQMRGLRDLSREERMSKRKELNEERLKRWTSALQDEPLAKKVAEFYEKQRQQRMQHGGGK